MKHSNASISVVKNGAYAAAAAICAVAALLAVQVPPSFGNQALQRQEPGFYRAQLVCLGAAILGANPLMRAVLTVSAFMTPFLSSLPSSEQASAFAVSYVFACCAAILCLGILTAATPTTVIASSFLAVASASCLRYSLEQPFRAAAFECTDSVASSGCGTGLAVSNTAETVFCSIGAACAFFYAVRIWNGSVCTRNALVNTAVLQGLCAAAATLLQSETIDEIPSVFFFGACTSGDVCKESMRARRFAAVNPPVAGNWICALAILALAGMLSKDKCNFDQPLLMLGFPLVLVGALSSWNGQYAWLIEAVALAVCGSLFLLRKGILSWGCAVYAFCLIVQLTIYFVYFEKAVFLYFTNWSRLVDCIALCIRVTVQSFSWLCNDRRTEFCFLLDLFGLSLSTFLFAGSHALTLAYSGALLAQDHSYFVEGLVDYRRAQLLWVLCHFVSVFVWAVCLKHSSSRMEESRASAGKRAYWPFFAVWVGSVLLPALCWLASCLALAEQQPYQSIMYGIFFSLGLAFVLLWGGLLVVFVVSIFARK